jgi:hypothetical protein
MDHPITNFAYGGFGQIYSRRSVQRLISPLYCYQPNNGTIDNTNFDKHADDFEEFRSNACGQIYQNLIGEQKYFQDGMSLVDLLLDARTKAEPYTKWRGWNSVDGGFCFHGDHYVATLTNLYAIANTMKALHESEIRIKKREKYVIKGANCKNEYENCDAQTSIICHHQTASQMVKLHQDRTQAKWDERNNSGPATFAAPKAFDVHFFNSMASRDTMKNQLTRYRNHCYEGTMIPVFQRLRTATTTWKSPHHRW